MIKQPRVSVVLPTYNRAHLLERAIKSVLVQTYQDFEIIVVDDGSTDHTKEVVENFGSDRIRYVRHEENKGGGAARNTGIKAAKGEYVAFQDSDDEWMAEKLEKQMKVFRNASPDVGVVYTGFWRLENNKRIYIPYPWIIQKEGNIHRELLKENFVTTQASLVRKECFTKAGVFDEHLPRLQDWELWIRISRNYDFKCIDEPLVIAYHQPDSISADQNALIKALELILEKHFQDIKTDRKLLAKHYSRIGSFLCSNGEFKQGRKYFIKAALAYPLNTKPILAAFVSLLEQSDYNSSRRNVPSHPRLVLKNAMTYHPKVSIIIVNWNGKELLKTCLDSLNTQTFRDFKVILVDNGSADGSVEFVKENYPKVEIIALDKNYGFAKGNNIGIEEALKDKDVEYTALLNNDTKVDKNWLQELVKVAESDEKIGSCQSKILSLDVPRVIDAVGIGIKRNGSAYQIGWQEEDNGQYENRSEVFGACACAALYRTEMLTQIGLFDEDFFACFEDVDLALRARSAGWKCMYVPEAVVYHKGSATRGYGTPFNMYFLGRNSYYYVIKNLPGDIIFKFLIWRTISTILSIIKIIKRTILRERKVRETKEIEFELSCSGGLSYLKGTFDAIKSIPRMLKKRRRIRSARLISDEELRRWFG